MKLKSVDSFFVSSSSSSCVREMDTLCTSTLNDLERRSRSLAFPNGAELGRKRRESFDGVCDEERRSDFFFSFTDRTYAPLTVPPLVVFLPQSVGRICLLQLSPSVLQKERAA